ncbi:hypothetical protein [Usitatibacter palustris]|uniref:Uncharacterized protein n=1 Tax=Usitatibacter palustris TaxID=2732487 RepID=A0A6M4H873_9PROT|nr:hypothetical protein [Usitatibacter palustris]QJR15355.1 hypothetical protein DSM104440_02174 [Usitatibacter palustris]
MDDKAASRPEAALKGTFADMSGRAGIGKAAPVFTLVERDPAMQQLQREKDLLADRVLLLEAKIKLLTAELEKGRK